MKIFNKEQNNVVVYLQIKDLKALINYDSKITENLINQVNQSKLNTLSDEQFIRITSKKDIEHLEEIDWIPDYREVRDLTEEQLTKTINEIEQNIKEIESIFASLTQEELEKSEQIKMQIAIQKYMLNSISLFLAHKQDPINNPLPLPLEIDSKNGIVETNGNLKIGLSLDKKNILIGTKNGEPCRELNPFELQMAITILISELGMIPENAEGLNIDVEHSTENKYLIANCTYITNKNNITSTSKEPTRIKSTQKMKSIFKKVFNPKIKDEN